jgi:hypothetical protein
MQESKIVLSNEVRGLLKAWKDPDGTPLRRKM